jgi:hypothetical protein
VGASHTLQGGGNNSNTVPKFYRFGRVPVTYVKAVITSPTNGSTLTSTTATFNWTASPGTGVTNYWLYIGTSPGTYNILSQNMGLTKFRTMAGLPSNGSNIYVRLWSNFPTGYQYNDYVYKSVTSGVKAVMTSPSNGSTLAGSVQTFSWSTGTSALQYWLYVGTSAGTYNITSSNMGTTRVKTVGGIPVNGSNVYVRLWTRFASGWEYNDYVYKAATAGIRAQMTSPTPGSTLGPTVTFSWNTGTSALQYWIYVGTSPGTYNYGSYNMGTTRVKTVAGLPLTGVNLYVRLWTRFGSGWEYYDYVYKMGIRALMTAPTASYLASTTTFSWGTGSGALQYWLYVGSTLGNYQYGSYNMGTTRTKTVAGLPANGSTVYVRLWTRFITGWAYVDYSYVMGIRATMTSPANGSTFTSSVQGFSWGTGTGALQYWIYAGSSLGNYNYGSFNMGTTRVKTIGGFPVNGSFVYVRLWTRFNSGWGFIDYVYRAKP